MSNLLECKNVTKYYGQGQSRFAAVNKVSIAFPNKGLVSIMGKSGSGKSTLLSLLSGMEKEDYGGIYYRGRKLLDHSSSELARIRSSDIAMVFQHYNLIEGASVLENASLPLSISGVSKGKAKRLLERFGLTKMAHRSVDSLSGGEKQRVALCRALSTSPSILFADEPTGALDEANSVLVMDALKEAAKECLVILVSHNASLVEHYSDAIIELADGKIISKRGKWGKKFAKDRLISSRHSRKWTWKFLFRNLTRHVWKNVICVSSGIVGFASIALSVGFFVGNKEALREEQTKTLSYQVASLSEKTLIDLPSSPLSLVQTSRPKKTDAEELLSSIPSVTIENDYGYFFPSSSSFRLDDVSCDPVSFLPIYDITLNEGNSTLLKQGSGASNNDFDCCLVNFEFLQVYDSDCLGKMIYLEHDCSVNINDSKDELRIESTLRIVGVVEEFSFLNGPKVYYSFQGLERKLSDIELTTLSKKEGRRIDIKTFVEEAEPSFCYTSYCSNVFVHDFRDVPSLYQKIKELEQEDHFSLTSSAYLIASTFSTLASAFETSLFLFVGIALLGLVLILGMSGYSNFIERKKESAILISLGARQSDILSIFAKESGLICFLAVLLSLLFLPLLEFVANCFLSSQFGMAQLIRVPFSSFLGVPYLFPILLILVAISLGLASTWLPLLFHQAIPLREELSDE